METPQGHFICYPTEHTSSQWQYASCEEKKVDSVFSRLIKHYEMLNVQVAIDDVQCFGLRILGLIEDDRFSMPFILHFRISVSVSEPPFRSLLAWSPQCVLCLADIHCSTYCSWAGGAISQDVIETGNIMRMGRGKDGWWLESRL